jgi:hypothetical protein
MDRQLVKPLVPVKGTTRCSFADGIVVFARPTVVLVYPERLDPSRLRDALACVLSDFGAFAGRLVRADGNWLIEHGVSAAFETAESRENCVALGTAVRVGHSKLVCPVLSDTGALRGKEPLFSARLTQTHDGSVLGITWNHVLGDNHSMLLLLRAWARAYRGEPYDKPLDVPDRDAYLHEHIPHVTHGEAPWRILSWSEYLRSVGYQWSISRDASRVTLEFPWTVLEAIHPAGTSERLVSPGVALCSHIFSMLHRFGDGMSPVLFTSINYRRKLRLPLNLLGNMSHFISVRTNPDDGADAIAAALRASIEAFNGASLARDQLQGLKDSHSGIFDLMRFWAYGEVGRTIISMTDVSRSGYHKLAFESAAPLLNHVRATDVPLVGLGTILASSGGTGLAVDIVLPSKVIERLARENVAVS